MRVPVIPLVVLTLMVGGAVGLYFLSPEPERALGAPIVTPLIDVEGVETEVAVAPDGQRYALISSGDLWYVDLASEDRRQLTETVEQESAPAWTGDGSRITFTRGADTLEVDPVEGVEAPRLEDARDLAWSAEGHVAFVRDRALWVAQADGTGARQVVAADPSPDVTITSPRFSPSGSQLLFLRSRLDLYGEVWRVELDSGTAFPIIADRRSESPSSAEWVEDDSHLVYLTDRSGGLAVWYADLETSTLLPMTTPLMSRPLSRLGIDVHERRIVLPRHSSDSDITTASGDLLVGGPGLQMEPAVSPDGRHVAFTMEYQGTHQLWVMERESGEVHFVGEGRHPRFAPDGNHLVYAANGSDGNRDIWKVDRRTGVQERLTDGEAVDDVPDWSPDGRTVVFSSSQSGSMALWSIPASGGRRQRLTESGYGPRYSPDGQRIAYWDRGAIWTAGADGGDPVRVAETRSPVLPVWSQSGPVFFDGSGIRLPDGRTLALEMWPEFDRIGDEAWLVPTLNVEATGLWSLDLTYAEE